MRMSSGAEGAGFKKASSIHSRRGRKGISTIIGIVIFFLIFMLAVSSTFIWTDNTSKYLQSAKSELEQERLRASENLMYSVTNGTHILLVNPTSMLVVVNQVWDGNHTRVWNGTLVVPAFDQVYMNMTNTTNKSYKMVTDRGNIFDQLYYPPYNGTAATGSGSNATGWNLTWYRYDGASPTTLGNSTHSALDFSWTFGGAWSFGTPSTTTAGFNASTRIIAKQSTLFVYLMLIDNPTPMTNFSTINFTIRDSGTFFQTVVTQMPINTSYPSMFTFSVTPGTNYQLFVKYDIRQPMPTTVHSVTVQIIGADLAPWN